jgi:hypothetical protein
MKKLLSILLISTLGLTSTFAGEGSSLFGFKGKVMLEDSNGKKVIVNLYDGNKKVSSYETGANGKFLLDISRNRHYTLEFVKIGYVTKRIIIDTKVNHRDAVGVKEFKFDIELFKMVPGYDYSDLDFPITILEFEKTKKEFVYNQKYTNQMLDMQDNILRTKNEVALK